MSDQIAPRDYFAQVPWSLMDGAPSDVWAVYAVLHRTARGVRQSCTKSLERLSRESGVGLNRTRRILGQLTDAGYVITVKRAGQPTQRRLNTDYPERYDPSVFRDSACPEKSTSGDTPHDSVTPNEIVTPHKIVTPTPHEIGRGPLTKSLVNPSRNRDPKQDDLREIYKNPPLTPQGGDRAVEGEEGTPTMSERSQASGLDPLTREMSYRSTHPRLVEWKGLVDLALDFPERWEELVEGRQGRFPCYAESVVDEVLEWLGGLSCYAERTLTRMEARDWISSRLRMGETDRVLGMLDLVKERALQRFCGARPELDPDADQKAAHAAALEQWRREQERSAAEGGTAS